MKISRIEIEGFRKYREPVVIDLRDSLGRTLDLAVLIGPNGCGKTTVMDAVALALRPSYQLPCTRPDLAFGVSAIVSRGRLQSRVILDLEFTDEELETTCRLVELAQKAWNKPVERVLRVTWVYPDDRSVSGVGFTDYEPLSGRALLSARKLVMDLLATRLVTPDWFERCGGVFTFDQQRSAMKKRIPVEIARLLRPNASLDVDESYYTDDTREILMALALKSKLTSRSKVVPQFHAIRDHFARLYPPLQMDVVLNEAEQPTVEFSDLETTFDYFGLSSGQQAALAYVVELVDKRIERSIVMIDEVELHQEEKMQRKLLHALQNLGFDNQLILSTHSSYLAEIVPHDSLIKMGYLSVDELSMEKSSDA